MKSYKYFLLGDPNAIRSQSYEENQVKNQFGGQTPSSVSKEIDSWFIQSTPPQSYKIQLAFLKIPKHLKLRRHYVDIPRNFRTLEEATAQAEDTFPQYEYRIVPSNQSPSGPSTNSMI